MTSTTKIMNFDITAEEEVLHILQNLLVVDTRRYVQTTIQMVTDISAMK